MQIFYKLFININIISTNNLTVNLINNNESLFNNTIGEMKKLQEISHINPFFIHSEEALNELENNETNNLNLLVKKLKENNEILIFKKINENIIHLENQENNKRRSINRFNYIKNSFKKYNLICIFISILVFILSLIKNILNSPNNINLYILLSIFIDFILTSLFILYKKTYSFKKLLIKKHLKSYQYISLFFFILNFIQTISEFILILSLSDDSLVLILNCISCFFNMAFIGFYSGIIINNIDAIENYQLNFPESILNN